MFQPSDQIVASIHWQWAPYRHIRIENFSSFNVIIWVDDMHISTTQSASEQQHHHHHWWHVHGMQIERAHIFHRREKNRTWILWVRWVSWKLTGLWISHFCGFDLSTRSLCGWVYLFRHVSPIQNHFDGHISFSTSISLSLIHTLSRSLSLNHTLFQWRFDHIVELCFFRSMWIFNLYHSPVKRVFWIYLYIRVYIFSLRFYCTH